MEEKLSVIITAFDHHDLTIAHIKHCMDVSRVPDEIVVVNDHGDPSLREMIEKIENKKCPIVYAYIKDDILWNYNGACNLGVWLSRGDYLAFEDNDNIPSFDFYKDAIAYFKKHPKLARIQATKRKVVAVDDIFNKPRSEWKILNPMGPNMGTAMFPRDVYLSIKGQDERFCGRYGWMFYDFRARLLKLAGRENYTYPVGEYFYVREGQSGLERPMSTQNNAIYRENARQGRTQHKEGILNFSWEHEVFT